MSPGVISNNLGFHLGTTGEQGIASAVTGTVLDISEQGDTSAVTGTGSSINATVRVPLSTKVTGSTHE
eukprot:2250347-Heterocapsa_arctica.AAC.1